MTNVKAGNALDLSGTDNKSIIGYGVHGGPNQQWELQRNDQGWTFKNKATGLYLSYEGEAQNGTVIVGLQQERAWDIWPDEENQDKRVHRIFVHNTTQNIDLSNHGDPTPGTPVTLWEKTRGKNQTWIFDKVE